MKLLEYQNEVFCNLVQEDGLAILAKGLGIEQIFVNLLKLYCDPINLVLVIGTTAKEEEYVLSKLAEDEEKHSPKVITAEFNSNSRNAIYMAGGVIFVTSRILVVDMLTDKIPIDLITGIVVYRAHKIIESCQEAFILRLYRQKNKTGFVKALSDSPFSFTTGFCQVNRIMKNLFVGNLHLWPRFHSNVQSSLEKFKPEVVELQLKMTSAMNAIQMSVLDLISLCIKELRRINPSIDTEELCVENAISKALDKVIKLQLDPVWHQLGPKTKHLVRGIKILRGILMSLTQNDCISFYNQINAIRSSEKSYTENSDWLVLDSAETMFLCAKERVYGKESSKKKSLNKEKYIPNAIEVNPKWLALSEVLNEIKESCQTSDEQSQVIVFAEDDRTCYQLKDYLTKGSSAVLKKIFMKTFLSNLKESNKDIEEESVEKDEDLTPNVMLSEEKLKLISSENVYYGVIKEPLTTLIPMKFVSDPFISQKFLNEFKPSFVVLYDVDLSIIRQLEVFKARHPELQMRVYFLIYEGSADEQRYLTILRKEKQAFEYLIKEKVTMVIPSDIEGRSENNPDLLRDCSRANETVNTRAGGYQTTSDVQKRVIVDMREFRSELPSLIHRRGIDIVPVTLEIGDYILTPDICVERKSVNDLIMSLNSGRLYNQAQAMSRHYKRPMLLIEFDHNKSFTLQGKFYLSNENSSNDVTSRLILLTLHFPKLRIIWSPNPFATAEIIEELKTGRLEPDTAQALAISSESSVEIPVHNFNHSSEDFLSKMPGVNQKNLKMLLRNGKSLSDLCNLKVEEINEILQNKKLSTSLHEAINQKFSNVSNSDASSDKKVANRRGKRKFHF